MSQSDVSRLLDSSEIVVHDQRDRWDALVTGLGGHPFQAWAWGELKRRYGWQPFRLAAADGSSAAQLLVRRHRGLAVAYVPRGPIVNKAGEIDSQLLVAMARLSRSWRAAFLRFEPAVLDDDPRAEVLTDQLRRAEFAVSQRSIQPRSSIQVDLTPPLDKIRAAFSTGRKGRIRTAERDGVTVRVAESEADVDKLYETLVATARRKGDFGIHTRGYYRRLAQEFGDDARVLLAERDGEVLSAQQVIAWGGHGIYLVGSSTAEGLKLHAAHLLQWHAIQWAREHGVHTWDLWGIADARGQLELIEKRGTAATQAERDRLEEQAGKDPLDSLLGFKKGWGGAVVRSVPAFDRVFIKPAYWYWQWRRGDA